MRKLMTLLTALFVAVMLLPSVAKAEDTRQVITEVNLTMDQLAPKCNEPVANPTITVPTNAVYKLGNNCGWKWKNENGVFVGTDYATVFIPGAWKYELQVRIDGENAALWRFPDKKDNLTVKVNGAKWILVGDPNVYDAYSWAIVRSPEFTITDEGVALNYIIKDLIEKRCRKASKAFQSKKFGCVTMRMAGQNRMCFLRFQALLGSRWLPMDLFQVLPIRLGQMRSLFFG